MLKILLFNKLIFNLSLKQFPRRPHFINGDGDGGLVKSNDAKMKISSLY